LALARQCRAVDVEPLHHFMHASRLPFDTPRHPPAHADLPVSALLNCASIAHRQGVDAQGVQAIAIHPSLDVAASQIARAVARGLAGRAHTRKVSERDGCRMPYEIRIDPQQLQSPGQ
jgi:hypothetical protein